MADPQSLLNRIQPTARDGLRNNVTQIVQTGAVAYGLFNAAGPARDLYRQQGRFASEYQQEITFPNDLIADRRNFHMSFRFMAYVKRAIGDQAFLRSQGTIRLPLPDNLKDNNSVTYSPQDLGPAVGAGLEQLMIGGGLSGLAPERTNSITETIGNIFDSGARAVGIAGEAVTGGAAGLVAGSRVGQAVSAYAGMAVNPYQTILFEKPEFKTHNFSWKIMPKNERESNDARNIFRTFQFHMSPGISQGTGLFFSYPSMVVVSLYPDSRFLYRFKPCVIRSVNINYAAGSNPSFFKRTDAPTAMTISIQLQEIEYWTNNDYDQNAFDESAATEAAAQVQTQRPIIR
jgi:hypothetical protein